MARGALPTMNKTWIKKGLVKSGITRLAARFKEPGAAVLMYHSVMQDPGRESATLGGIIHSCENFSRQMELLAREYTPISLDELMGTLSQGKALRPRSVVVTFDDGYADNHEQAMPILNRIGIPATFYITVDCVETAKLPWPSRLRFAFFTSKKTSWHDINSTKNWTLGDAAQRDQAFLHACDLCAKLAGPEQEQYVEGIEQELQAGPPQPARRLMMTWDQVRDLAKNGHIVGSHTLSHPNMAYVGADMARTELAESKRKLEAVLGAPTVHFSYPCPALWPHWSDGTRKMTEEVGYHTAVTTVGGAVHQNDDLLALNRVRPTKELEGLRWNLECTFLGRVM